MRNIGFYFADNSRQQGRDKEVLKPIQEWASENKIDVVVWTDLENNFKEKSKCKKPFSVKTALLHIQALDNEGKAMASEYVWRAPEFIATPVREALQSQPWFQKHG